MFMCEYCEPLNYTKEREKLEFIGSRIVNDMERHYYRCPECDQAFYWFDWASASNNNFLEVLSKKASEIMILFQE